MKWERMQQGMLAATLLGSVCVLAKTAIAPKSPPPPPRYDFPAVVPLKDWQFVQSTPIAVETSKLPALATSVDAQTVAGQHYRYWRSGTPLDIEMRYFVDTYIHVPSILEDSTLKSDPPDFKQKETQTGEYALLKQNGKVHRSACITQYGGTSVGDRQLRKLQNTVPVLSQRFSPWFLGQAPLKDLRCVWVKMSLDARVVEDNPQFLEQSWINWVQWWQGHYPKDER